MGDNDGRHIWIGLKDNFEPMQLFGADGSTPSVLIVNTGRGRRIEADYTKVANPKDEWVPPTSFICSVSGPIS
jgi:hypothetical protein